MTVWCYVYYSSKYHEASFIAEVILKRYISACYVLVAILVWIIVVIILCPSFDGHVQRRHACFVDINSTGGCL